jgi:hypothetical protein
MGTRCSPDQSREINRLAADRDFDEGRPRGLISWRVEVALLNEKQLRRGIHRSTRDPEAAIDRYLTVYNEARKPFVWTKTADDILASVARFCHRIWDSGH